MIAGRAVTFLARIMQVKSRMDAENRLLQEVARLGGHFAHVHDEAIDPRHDEAAGEAWLHGRFSYMLYRRQPDSR